MNEDNKLYQYALTQASTEADFIYFDEIESKEKERDNLDSVRLIFVNFLEASGGSLSRLQILMCLFSGLSLRESSRICKVSHEQCRTVLSSIQEDYPLLHKVIKEQSARVDIIVPDLLEKRYKVIDKQTGKESYYYSPSHIKSKYKIATSTICKHVQRGSRSPIAGRYLIYNLRKEREKDNG